MGLSQKTPALTFEVGEGHETKKQKQDREMPLDSTFIFHVSVSKWGQSLSKFAFSNLRAFLKSLTSVN